MSDPAESLPDDIDALRALVRSALVERDAARVERDHAVEQIDRLRHLLKELQRARFGRSSERLDPDQLQLALEEIEQAVAQAEAEIEKRAATRMRVAKPRLNERQSLPAHLPRVEVVITPEDTACPCCKGQMHMIGEETAERLDVIPAQYRVLVTRRPKYACRACGNGIVQAPAPERLIKGGLPTEAMVAHVLVSKYAWHLPLYRQAQMLKSQGIVIERMTLASWVGYAAAELAPVVARLREILLGSVKLVVDETPVPVLDPGRGRTKTGYFWTMARDDRPWGNDDPPAVAYSYAPGRGAEHAVKLLADYSGIVQCDGYAAYKQLLDRRRNSGPAALAFCWAHWRRDFMRSRKPVRRRSRRKRSRALLRSMQSRSGSVGAAPRNALRCVKQRVSRLSMFLNLGSKANSGACPANRSLPAQFAMASNIGMASCASSPTAASRWTPMRSSARSVRSRLPARTRCSQAATKAPPTGLPLPR